MERSPAVRSVSSRRGPESRGDCQRHALGRGFIGERKRRVRLKIPKIPHVLLAVRRRLDVSLEVTDQFCSSNNLILIGVRLAHQAFKKNSR